MKIKPRLKMIEGDPEGGTPCLDAIDQRLDRTDRVTRLEAAVQQLQPRP